MLDEFQIHPFVNLCRRDSNCDGFVIHSRQMSFYIHSSNLISNQILPSKWKLSHPVFKTYFFHVCAACGNTSQGSIRSANGFDFRRNMKQLIDIVFLLTIQLVNDATLIVLAACILFFNQSASYFLSIKRLHHVKLCYPLCTYGK